MPACLGEKRQDRARHGLANAQAAYMCVGAKGDHDVLRNLDRDRNTGRGNWHRTLEELRLLQVSIGLPAR